jgi:uncharacterized protein (DUF3820 family)
MGTATERHILTDESLMPYGKYKGLQMIKVPANHLIWLYENNRCSVEVKEYVLDNLEVLKDEIKRNPLKRYE